MAVKNVTVTTTAGIIHTPGAGENVLIRNAGPATAWISTNAAVTTSTAIPLGNGSELRLVTPFNDIGSGATAGIYGITSSGTAALTVNGLVT